MCRVTRAWSDTKLHWHKIYDLANGKDAQGGVRLRLRLDSAVIPTATTDLKASKMVEREYIWEQPEDSRSKHAHLMDAGTPIDILQLLHSWLTMKFHEEIREQRWAQIRTVDSR